MFIGLFRSFLVEICCHYLLAVIMKTDFSISLNAGSCDPLIRLLEPNIDLALKRKVTTSP